MASTIQHKVIVLNKTKKDLFYTIWLALNRPKSLNVFYKINNLRFAIDIQFPNDKSIDVMIFHDVSDLKRVHVNPDTALQTFESQRD